MKRACMTTTSRLWHCVPPPMRCVVGRVWSDTDRVHRLITEEIPTRVAADPAYQNARKNSDKQNARIEHDKALARVMTALLQDDTELFKQFSDNESFRGWMRNMVFDLTYPTDFTDSTETLE